MFQTRYHHHKTKEITLQAHWPHYKTKDLGDNSNKDHIFTGSKITL